jgi:hypothetical protein
MLRHALIALLFLVVGLALIAVSSYVLCDAPMALLGHRRADCGHLVWWDLQALSRSMAALVMWPTGAAALCTGIVWLAARRYARPFVVVTALGVVGLVCAGAVLQQAPSMIVQEQFHIC